MVKAVFPLPPGPATEPRARVGPGAWARRGPVGRRLALPGSGLHQGELGAQHPPGLHRGVVR
eukprot:3038715-Alexandrium_andersonii.AAC.1